MLNLECTFAFNCKLWAQSEIRLSTRIKPRMYIVLCMKKLHFISRNQRKEKMYCSVLKSIIAQLALPTFTGALKSSYHKNRTV